ncbi:cadherin-related tumor suppressor-like [Phlebotomus argentipes]|uniref:cadherin-related tumor suppressor-like n=1 Tax=Phlebotomus argentipes TaxID=94469 RepID=UPI0028929CD3|nr:cadherin-related tumor suppressor-like [Phlebotomus argentipes]
MSRQDKFVINSVKCVLLICLCFSHMNTIAGQRCTITDVEQDNFITLPIIPIGQPSTLATYNMESTIAITNITNNADSGKIFISADYNAELEALTLFTTDEFPNYAQFEERTTIIMTISFSCVSLTRDITFSQALVVSNDHDPEFLQTEYEFTIPLPLPANFDLSVFQEIAARDIDIGENGVTFSADSEYVTIGTSAVSREPKTYYATMTTKTQILSIVHSIAFEITATDIGGRSSSVNVYITSDGENKFIMRPVFESPFYSGVLDEDFVLHMDSSVILDTDTYDEEEVTFALQGEDSRFFSFTNFQNVINIELQGEITEEDIEEKNFLQFFVVASRPGIEDGSAAVVIDLMKTCPEITTLSPPTTPEPPTCPTVTCPEIPTDGTTDEPSVTSPLPEPELCPDPEGPVFQDDFYTYRVFYGQLGSIGTVRATHPDESPVETIEYSLNFKDESLQDKIAVDAASGQISLLDQLLPEAYGFEVFASIIVDGERKVGRALVTVIVESNEQCSPTPVEMSLMVRRLKENAEHEIMSTTIADCQFEILGFQPNDQEYFFIEDQLLKSIAFDREADIFTGMMIPQFQISLKLECPETRRKRSIARWSFNPQPRDLDGPKEYVYTNDIPHASTVTVVNVIVEDENDNKPEIIFPTPADGLTFGYPEPNLADKLLLSHVLQVKAIDRDEGENAIVKFAMFETNNHFTIDSESGIIYPKRNALASSTLANLRVIATDREEDEGTLQGANVNIAIHRLSSENIAVVTVEDVSLPDAETVRQSILSADDARILILHSTTIPGAQDSALRQSADTVVMKFLIYGFSSENDRLLTTPQIEQRMSDVTEKFHARTSPLDEVISVLVEDKDLTGFIVGLSIMGAAILALIICAFWGWWKYIRPYEYKTMENESVMSDDNGLTPDFDKKAVIDGDIPEPIRLSETYNDPERQSPQMYNLESNGIQTTEPKPESPPKERRKSIVTFNEDVERIEIVTEVPADTQSDSEKEVNYKF